MISSLGTLAVLAHTVVVLLHGAAHRDLGAALSVWQKNYASIVILIGPVIAALLLWTRHFLLGLVLLTLSMAGSLAFGLYYHYVAVSPDNVWHLPAGDAQAGFRLSASLLSVTETFGLAVGVAGLLAERA